MQKNVASQKWIVFAFDRTDNTPKTGDAANITAEISKEGAAGAALGDANPVELEDGYYVFDLTQAETNADLLLLLPESSTSNIQVIGVPGVIYTDAPNFNKLGIESDGDLTKVNTLNGHTAQSGNSYPNVNSYLDATISSRSDFDETTDPVELLDTGGSAGTSADELVDDVWDEILTGATHNIATSAGRRLRELVDADVLDSGTVQSPYTASTLKLDTSASSLNDYYNECFAVIVDGTGAGQARHIQSYVGGTKICNIVENWVTTPDATSKYEIKVFSLVHTHEVDELGAQAKADVNAEVDQALLDYDSSNGVAKEATALLIKAKTDGLNFTGNFVQSEIKSIEGSTARSLKWADLLDAQATDAVVSDVGNSNTQFKTTLSNSGDDNYIGRIITFVDGVLEGQSTIIEDWDGTNKIVTVTAMTGTPGDGDKFVVT
jgi:hypothetical protein